MHLPIQMSQDFDALHPKVGLSWLKYTAWSSFPIMYWTGTNDFSILYIYFSSRGYCRCNVLTRSLILLPSVQTQQSSDKCSKKRWWTIYSLTQERPPYSGCPLAIHTDLTQQQRTVMPHHSKVSSSTATATTPFYPEIQAVNFLK